MDEIVLLTDHGSGEGSRPLLATAVERLTGRPPVSIDARHFRAGGDGRASIVEGRLRLDVPSLGFSASPSVVLIYEIPPVDRGRYQSFQQMLRKSRTISLGAEREAWRNATEKNRTVQCFLRDHIPQMETISLHRPSAEVAERAFERLGGDVWARPTIGLGGNDVFHLTSREQLLDALGHYGASEKEWLMARDAQNYDRDGRRHQFRIVVLHDRVIRTCEHLQTDPDAPCNEAQGAVATVVPIESIPTDMLRLAVLATKSVGLPFGGVDLAVEQGGVVFEVNVHPVLDVPGGLETVALPYVEAHLAKARCIVTR